MTEQKPKSYLKQKTVREIIIRHFKTPKTKINPRPVKYLTIAVNAMIMEVILRAANQTFSEGETEITSEILEKILPQLALDM